MKRALPQRTRQWSSQERVEACSKTPRPGAAPACRFSRHWLLEPDLKFQTCPPHPRLRETSRHPPCLYTPCLHPAPTTPEPSFPAPLSPFSLQFATDIQSHSPSSSSSGSTCCTPTQAYSCPSACRHSFEAVGQGPCFQSSTKSSLCPGNIPRSLASIPCLSQSLAPPQLRHPLLSNIHLFRLGFRVYAKIHHSSHP